jgi:L-threonylcarbamoyladenylate synthase
MPRLTETLLPDPKGIEQAAIMLRQGELVAFPTETVYGLGADARSDIAVARIFAAKDRPAFNPLIVHVHDQSAAEIVALFDDRARHLAAAFWPGPLTLVLPLRPQSGISPLLTAGQTSVAIRIPRHPVAQALLRSFGGPVAAPSANLSGRISPTSADHVREGMSGRIAAVLDSGSCPVGVESTIVSLTGEPALLRPGGVPVEALEAVLGVPLPEGHAALAGPLAAPGMMASHYAPVALVRLNAVSARPGEVLIGFGEAAGDPALNLSARGDLAEAAARLFHILRLADAAMQGQAAGSKVIAVAPIPETGLGRAINDRLRRAAAPRMPSEPGHYGQA